MTLHWWMHWFWVTILWFSITAGTPLPTKNRDIETERGAERSSNYIATTTTTTTTASTKLWNTTKEEDDLFPSETMEPPSSSTTFIPNPNYPISSSSSSSSLPSLLKENYRVPKAIGINPNSASGVKEATKNDHIDVEIRDNSTISIVNNDYRVDRDAKRDKISVLKFNNDSSFNQTNENLKFHNDTRTSSLGFNRSMSLVKKDSKVTWIINDDNNNSNNSNNNNNNDNNNNNKTLRNDKLSVDSYRRNYSLNVSNDDNDEDDRPMAVLPLHEPIPTRFKLVLNKTKIIPSTNVNDDDDDDNDEKLINKSRDVEIREDIVETRIMATAASILQGVSESPRLSRARSAFPGDYQHDELQEQRKGEKPSQNSYNNATGSAVDIAAVTGSCLATLVLIGTMGSLGFVMYRRRYLNPPQTLNSDKCSNPDSSGYIDDSTIRDNSEEMYSLDNDSFLNSLEAMTIQNYWTDSVKHTKL